MPGREVEIKLRIASSRAARRQLARLGFRVVRPRRLEENVLFDTPGGKLRRAGLMLRLRSVDGRALLTFKGRKLTSRGFKVRPEVETPVDSAGAVGEILQRLGFRPIFLYEKYRTVFARRRESGEVVLDETPVGAYLELEGSPAWIRRVAHSLRRKPAEFLTATYADLYRRWRRRHGGPAQAMVFGRKR